MLFRFGFVLLAVAGTFATSQANPNRFRIGLEIDIDGKSIGRMGSARNGRVSLTGEGGARYFYDNGKVTNLKEKYPDLNIGLYQMGPGLVGAVWRSEGEPAYGYYANGQLVAVPGLFGAEKGGGDWIGSIRAYNPFLNQFVDCPDHPQREMVASNSRGTIVFQGSDELSDLEPQNIYSWSNGVMRQRTAGGYARALNDNDVILIQDIQRLYFLSPSNILLPVAGTGRMPWIIDGGQLSNSNRVMVRQGQVAGSSYYLNDGDKWSTLESLTDGLPSDRLFYHAEMDPVTDSVYAFYREGNKWGCTRLDPVPEPGTLAALGLGVAAMLRRRRKG